MKRKAAQKKKSKRDQKRAARKPSGTRRQGERRRARLAREEEERKREEEEERKRKEKEAKRKERSGAREKLRRRLLARFAKLSSRSSMARGAGALLKKPTGKGKGRGGSPKSEAREPKTFQSSADVSWKGHQSFWRLTRLLLKLQGVLRALGGRKDDDVAAKGWRLAYCESDTRPGAQ